MQVGSLKGKGHLMLSVICIVIDILSRPSFNYNSGQEYLKTSYYQASSTWHLSTQLDVFAWEIIKYFDCEWGGWKEKLVWSSFLIFSPHHQSGIWKCFPCFWRSPTWWKNLCLESIAHICHYRHNRRWCTFFELVYFLIKRMPNFGLFWLFLHVITFLSAILSQIYTLLVYFVQA